MTQEELEALFERYAKESAAKGISQANIFNMIGIGRYFAHQMIQDGIECIDRKGDLDKQYGDIISGEGNTKSNDIGGNNE